MALVPGTPTGAGAFITFEGGEGAGKTTQAWLLVQRLRKTGREIVETREPGGTPFAEAVRRALLDPATQPQAPLAEALAFYAARADHLTRVIVPAVARGAVVICDRFSDSTRAYQGAAGGVPRTTLDALEQLVVGGYGPSLTLYLDVDPKIGLARANRRAAADGFEARTLAFHNALRAGFLDLAKAEPTRFVVLDGTADPDILGTQIWHRVAAHLGITSEKVG